MTNIQPNKKGILLKKGSVDKWGDKEGSEEKNGRKKMRKVIGEKEGSEETEISKLQGRP